MQRWCAAAFSLILLLAAPMAQAVTWEDPAEDQEMTRRVVTGNSAPEDQWIDAGAAGWYPQSDVLSASIEETADDIIFDVTLSAFDSTAAQEPPFPDANFRQWSYAWHFTYDEQPLVAAFDIWDPDEDFVWFAVYEVQPQEYYDRYLYKFIWFGEKKSDEAGYHAEVPKWIWRNADGVPMREGDALEDMTFRAGNSDRFRFSFGPCPNTEPTGPQGPWSYDCGWEVRDLLEDGASLGDFNIEKTPEGVGHLFSRIDDPIRQSNGLATTYLFELQVHNLEPESDTVFLQVQDIPKGWEVHHPAAVVFDDVAQTTVPIAVTVPFQHEHGKNHIMELTVLSDRDPTATMDLFFGVVFADPPQPAGHHDTLHLHADDDGWWGWMNTMTTDPEASGGPIGAWSVSYGVDTFEAGWEIQLNPSLDIGLDFDVSETADLRFPIEFPQDFDGDVQARLMLYDWMEDDYTLLADGIVEGFTATGGTAKEVQVALAIEPSADRVPPQRNKNLVLMVNATGQSLPSISTGSRDIAIHTDETSLTLPLVDYHDEVDLTGLVVTALDIQARNGSYAAVNPGRTAVMGFNVTNLLDEKLTIDWEIRGSEPFTKWAAVATPTTHLQPDGDGVVVISYAPPASATEDDVAELVLIGTAREDEDRQVFTRAVFFIETDEDIPDAAEEAQTLRDEADAANAKNRKESPGLPLLVLLVGVVAAGRLRRR